MAHLETHSVADEEFGKRLRYLAMNGNLKEAERELEHAAEMAGSLIASPGTGGQNALHRAVFTNDLELVTLFLNEGDDNLINLTDDEGRTPLHYATRKRTGEADMVNLLLSYDPDVNMRTNSGFTPLHQCAIENFLELARILIDAGADLDIPNENGWTPLLFALSHKHDRMAVLLAENGCDLLATSDEGICALHLAESPDLVTTILQNSEVSVNCQNDEGWTPLMTACSSARGNLRIVELLATTDGAFLNVTKSDGCTALHVAVGAGHKDVVEFLLSVGASADTANSHGATPLMVALERKNIDIAEVLIEHSNVNAKNSEGDTALSITIRAGLKRVVRLLVAAGAKIRSDDLHIAKEKGDLESFLRFAKNSDLAKAVRSIHMERYLLNLYDAELDSLYDCRKLEHDHFVTMGIAFKDIQKLQKKISKVRPTERRSSLSQRLSQSLATVRVGGGVPKLHPNDQ